MHQATSCSLRYLYWELSFLTAARGKEQEPTIVKPFNPGEFGTVPYRGILVPDPFVVSILEQNRESARKAHSKVHSPTPESLHTRVDHAFRMRIALSELGSDLPCVFCAVLNQKKAFQAHSAELLSTYSQIHSLWRGYCGHCDARNLKTHDLSIPRDADDEIYGETTIIIPEDCGADAPMLPDLRDPGSHFFDDQNMLVSDPPAEYAEFKNRTKWSQKERRILYSEFARHRKDFRKIADTLPSRSTKDVIEFYYLNRHTPEMEQVFSTSRKRSRGFASSAAEHSLPQQQMLRVGNRRSSSSGAGGS